MAALAWAGFRASPAWGSTNAIGLTGGDGRVAVFIDIIGLPFAPLSFAGMAVEGTPRSLVWRRGSTVLSRATDVVPVSAAIGLPA